MPPVAISASILYFPIRAGIIQSTPWSASPQPSFYYGRSSLAKNGVVTLNQDGFASIEFDFDGTNFPSPRHVTVTTEVRDQRNQTLSADAATTIHSSNVYLGVSRVDRLVRVGEDLDLKAVLVTSDGKPAEETFSVSLRIEREVNEQIKTKTESGTIAVRNEKRIELIEDRPLRERLGAAARKTVEESFTDTHIAQRTVDYYGRVTTNGRQSVAVNET